MEFLSSLCYRSLRFLRTCIFTSVQKYMCVGMHVCVYVCTWKSEDKISCCSSVIVHLVFGDRVSHWSGNGWPVNSRDQPVFTSQRWDYKCVSPYLTFFKTWVLRIKLGSLFFQGKYCTIWASSSVLKDISKKGVYIDPEATREKAEGFDSKKLLGLI